MLCIILLMCIIFNGIYGDIAMNTSGDFIIGALFRIHRAFNLSDESFKCERIGEIHGIQKLEGAILALNMINNNIKILPGVTLGLEARDICSSKTAALRETLVMVDKNIIKDSWHDYQNKKLYLKNSTIIGIIGSDTSERTIQVQNFLKLFRIPQIVYNANTSELDDKNKYSTYLQIRPSDARRGEVIRDILKKFGWTYIAMISSKDFTNDYILDSFYNFVEPKCQGCRICIAKNFSIETHQNKSEIEEKIREIAKKTRIQVVICFCNKDLLREVFEATKRLNLTQRFTFILSDYWEDHDMIMQGVEDQAWGSIFVNIHTKSITGFSKYYTSLKPSINTHNPIFNQFWEEKFNCILPIRLKNIKQMKTHKTISKLNMLIPTKFCTGYESLSENYQESKNISFIVKGVVFLAYGLHSMLREICGIHYFGASPKMYLFNGSKLINHLMKQTVFFDDELVKIDNGTSVLRYDIMNFQKLPNNTFTLVNIGDWINGTLTFHGKFQSRENQNVTSVCSLPCRPGYRKKVYRYNENQVCCWECEICGYYDYVSRNQEQCIECGEGKRPNATRTGCDTIPITELNWTDPLIILIISFSIAGFFVTLYTLYIFIKYRNTPVVKASNREICYVILFGMLLAHITVFIIFEPRSQFHCGLTRIIPEVSGIAMYAGLFIKTYRIARILVHKEDELPTKKLKLMSTSAQVVIAFSCIVFEIVICLAMFIINPPDFQLVFLTREIHLQACLITPVTSIPPVILIGIFQILCIIYGIKIRNVPKRFNESKFIGFAMIISFIINVLSTTVVSNVPFRPYVVATNLNFNALVILIFLFLPKLYIIHFKPEKNNRSLFITSKSIRTHIGPNINASNDKSELEYSREDSSHDISLITESSCRLRKNVGIQTNAKLQNISSSFSINDNKSLNENGDNSQYNKSSLLFESDEEIIATIDDNSRSIFSWSSRL